MTLQAGARLGPYQVVGPVGAGGMGEVYKARDTRLDRTVALKVLPEHLSTDSTFRQRFEREARTISSLSHPNICALYDVGHQDGLDYLVMEFLEGETLADRISKGTIPVDLALRIAVEIADALDKAHRQGIVHRDLKPGNIMLTKSGAKLLDFGLARLQLRNAEVVSGLSVLATEAGKSLTAEGSIVGTFQYMAPEQLEGKEVDSRTDIFALGLVLYEMLTGKRAFTGKSQASLIAAILEKEPEPISNQQPLTPPALERTVKACLAKDPDERWQNVHDLKNELKWIREGGSQAGSAAIPVQARRRLPVSWLISLALLLACVVFAVLYFKKPATMETSGLRVSVLPPDNLKVVMQAISPDARNLVFVGTDTTGKSQLWIRALDSQATRMLPDTTGVELPFWSPDSASVGFFADGKVKRINIAAGRPEVICSAPDARGGSWNRDGVILFSTDTVLKTVSSRGGNPVAVSKLDSNEEAHRWPVFLPDGKHYLYLGDSQRTETHSLKLGTLGSFAATALLHSFISSIAFCPQGYVLYMQQGELVAQRFDAASLKLVGDPNSLAAQVAPSFPNHGYDFSVSDRGVLSYRRMDPTSQLTWFDRSGKILDSIGEPDRYVSMSLSPDGKRVAAEKLDADSRNGEIWLLDVARKFGSRFTLDPQWDGHPVWSPDGSQVAFYSDRNQQKAYSDIFVKPSGGGGNDEIILHDDSAKTPFSWSPDGQFIVFGKFSDAGNYDLYLLHLPDRTTSPLMTSQFKEYDAAFSPDGRWLTYVSDESGSDEVYVQPFPFSGAKYQISSNGGTDPIWRQDGKELFFYGPEQKLWAASIQTQGGVLDPGVPQPLFQLALRKFGFESCDYSVADNGQRFLVNVFKQHKDSEAIHLIFDFAAHFPRN